MFHTPIDRGHRGAWSKIKHLFFFFSTQCANGSPPPGVKINQTSSSFLILSAEQPPGSVAKQYYCCGTGERRRPVAISTVMFDPWRNVRNRVKDAAGKSHQMGWDDASRYLINVHRDFFFFALCVLRWKSINPLSRWNYPFKNCNCLCSEGLPGRPLRKTRLCQTADEEKMTLCQYAHSQFIFGKTNVSKYGRLSVQMLNSMYVEICRDTW